MANLTAGSCFAVSSSLALLALVLIGPAGAAPQELIPGLTYERKIEFTTRGPGRRQRADRAAQRRALVDPARALERDDPRHRAPDRDGAALLELRDRRRDQRRPVRQERCAERDADAERRARPAAASRSLERRARPARCALRRARDDARDLAGRRPASGARSTSTARPGANGAALYTSAYGPATPAQPGSFELIFASFPAAAPNQELAATGNRRICKRRHADPADGRRPRRPRHRRDLHAEGGARPGRR